MELHRTDEGFALYKEKTQIGFCALTPAAKGAAITAFGIEPQWRRKGYGSYLLKEALRAYAGYDREKATVFTAPLPADAAELAFWAKFGFAAEGRQLVRRRTPDLTAVKFVQDFLAARLAQPHLCIDATCGNGGDTAFLCGITAPEGKVVGFDVQEAAIASTRKHLEQLGVPAARYELHLPCRAAQPVKGLRGFGSAAHTGRRARPAAPDASGWMQWPRAGCRSPAHGLPER